MDFVVLVIVVVCVAVKWWCWWLCSVGLLCDELLMDLLSDGESLALGSVVVLVDDAGSICVDGVL